ncbi:MAG: hypothetical protein U0Q21_00325 [Dermatophilaceae bacterium]
MTTPTDHAPPPWSLGEEAARLFASLQEERGPEAADHPRSEVHSAACTWCPLCRGVDSLRSVDPDAVDRLAHAISELAHALADLGSTLRERVVPPGYEAPMRPHPQTGASHSGERVDIPITDIPVIDEDAQ